MDTIVHRIRLLDVAHAEAFEDWVINTDYATCPDLPSVVDFSVHKVSNDPDAPFHYFEVIKVTSDVAFDKDQSTQAFQSLVARFVTMAEVVEEFAGVQLGDGYRA